MEIQNIRAHYRKLGKNEEAYVESFDNIASQYTDAQLKVIVKFLPLNVRAVLERDSSKYQHMMAFSGESARIESRKETAKKDNSLKIDFIENQLNKQKLTKPVIVPSAVNAGNVKKLSTKPSETTTNAVNATLENKNEKPEVKPNNQQQVNIFELDEEKEEVPMVEPVKRGRGRPKKILTEEELKLKEEKAKRGRGRPRKVAEPVPTQEKAQSQASVNLFAMDQEETTNQEIASSVLPGFEELEQQQNQDAQGPILPGIDESQEAQVQTNHYMPNKNVSFHNEIIKPNVQNVNIETLLTKDKKIVSFVGTTKNGTSFLVNNLAELFSSMGIKTAILDTTKNKNSYFIYTKNEEELRKVAINCMEKLESGITEGIKVNDNLTVYTSLPSKQEQANHESILATLIKNHSLVLIDSDFDTPYTYFEHAQEIYLVQSMDILTIQPLTAFVRDLKAKDNLIHEKLKVIINKYTKVRGLNSKVVIGGMAFYNDPSMSFMTELFNKDTIKHVNIPFDESVYAKYIEGLVNCKVSLNGYGKNFLSALKELGNMVYPLLNNKYKPLDTFKK